MSAVVRNINFFHVILNLLLLIISYFDIENNMYSLLR